MNIDFVLIITLMVLVVVATASTWKVYNQHRLYRLRELADRLRYLRTSRTLIQTLQQHRGRCSAYLSGDHSVQSALFRLQKDLDHLFVQLDQWNLASDDWQALRLHWNKLKEQYQSLSLHAVLSQHGQLIESFIFRVHAQAAQLQLDQVRLPHGRNLLSAWFGYLSMAESLGQARAIGSSVATRGLCDNVAAIRLTYLSAKLNKLVSAQPELAHTDLERFLPQLTEALQERPNQVDAAQYFKDSTALIDHYFAAFDQLLESLSVTERQRQYLASY